VDWSGPAGRLAGQGSPRTGLLLNPIVPVQRLRCLMLCLFGYHASFRHDVTTFMYQALVDRQMIVSG
jgi:hypothetical protein